MAQRDDSLPTTAAATAGKSGKDVDSSGEERTSSENVPRTSLTVEDLATGSLFPLSIQDSRTKSDATNSDDLDDYDVDGDDDEDGRKRTQRVDRNDDTVALLVRRLDKLQSKVDRLQRENKRLSSATFDFLNGSAMNNDMGDNSDRSSIENSRRGESTNNTTIGLRSLQTLPVRLQSNGSSSSQPSPTKQQPEKDVAEKRWSKYQECLHEQYEHDFSRRSSLIFLHPGVTRDYTSEELKKIRYRPFPSRLFITNVQLEGNTAWLRTRHTDHHEHKSSFIQVRDAIKADAITQNPPGAKYALTELLNMCYGMNESDYYSFACTLASAFSCGASNTEFEKSLLLHPVRKEVIVRQEREAGIIFDTNLAGTHRHLDFLKKEQKRARTRLLQVMDIVFSKLKQKNLLVDDSKANIYRLVLCMTKHSNNRWPFVYAIFSFFFQVCAATYVALSLTTLDEGPDGILGDWDLSMVGNNFALALGTACYGMMVAYPEMKSTGEVYRHLYRSDVSLLAFMDFVVNFLLPISGAFCGFFVVLRSDSFLDGVLNAVALIFITEIDDQLPGLLELDTMDIVQGFLIDQAMSEYETQDLHKTIPSIEFSDMHITNTEECGSVPSRGVTFQPYEVFGESSQRSSNRGGSARKVTEARVKVRKGDMGQQVANKRSVTKDCLLRKVEWQYTGGFEESSTPRIGHLRLHKLIDGSLVDIEGKQKAKPELNKPWFSVTGVYIITSFGMSDDVLRLRICGSTTTNDFLRAFQYYNLWPLGRSAKTLLKNAVIGHTEDEKRENDKVLCGLKQPENAVPFVEYVAESHAACTRRADLELTETIHEEDEINVLPSSTSDTNDIVKEEEILLAPHTPSNFAKEPEHKD